MAISTGFSTALTGLSVHQKALDITSNNISNASNQDYTRQRAAIETLGAVNTIPGDIGLGVHIKSIYRIQDTFLFNRLTDTQSKKSFLDTQEQYLSEITAHFPDVTDDGIYKSLEDFFNAWQTFANNPNDGSVKVDLAAKTDALSNQIKDLRNKLKDIQKSINDDIEVKVNEANNIIKQIAKLNGEITRHEANGTSKANDLRDKRDALEKRLKEIINPKVLKNPVSLSSNDVNTTGYDKNYSILLGGRPLVDGTSYNLLQTTDNLGNKDINIQTPDHRLVNITKDVKGGEVGALIDIRGTEYDKSGAPVNGNIGEILQNLNSFSQGLIRSVNSIYSYSAQESVTTDTLTSIVSVSPDMAKTPLPLLKDKLKNPVRDGNLDLDIYDNNGNKVKEIEVSIDKNKSINDILSDINTAFQNNDVDMEAKLQNGEIKFVPKDVDGDGTISASAALVKDDGSLLFKALGEVEHLPLKKVNDIDLPIPLENGSFDVVAYNSDGDEVARRTIKIDMNSTNPKYSTIDGILAQINTPNIDDNDDNDNSNDVDDYYHADYVDGKFLLSKKTDDTTYVGLDNDTANIGGAFGVNKFFDGDDASNISLSRRLEDDPSLIHAYKPPQDGNNEVANAMLNLQTDKITFHMEDGTTTQQSIYEFYRSMTSSLANKVEEVKSKQETTETVLKSVSNEYYSISGVNLDEELINLEKFQRGYQANAKVITTINKMLDALFNIG